MCFHPTMGGWSIISFPTPCCHDFLFPCLYCGVCTHKGSFRIVALAMFLYREFVLVVAEVMAFQHAQAPPSPLLTVLKICLCDAGLCWDTIFWLKLGQPHQSGKHTSWWDVWMQCKFVLMTPRSFLFLVSVDIPQWHRILPWLRREGLCGSPWRM